MNEEPSLPPNELPEKKTKNVIVFLLLIIFPPVGITLLWSITKWSKISKIFATFLSILILLVAGVSITFSLVRLAYYEGGIQPFQNQDKLAQTYLKDKYGKEFSIGESTGSDQLGGPVTFNKTASLDEDPSVKFHVSKCLARCSSEYNKTYFTDTYINGLWSKQAGDQLKKNLPATDISKVATVSINGPTDNVFNEQTKEIKPFTSLSSVDRSKLSYSLSYVPVQRKTLTYEEKVDIATQVMKAVDYLKTQNLAYVDVFMKVLTEEEVNPRSQRLYQPAYFVRIATPRVNSSLPLNIDEVNVEMIVTNSFKKS